MTSMNLFTPKGCINSIYPYFSGWLSSALRWLLKSVMVALTQRNDGSLRAYYSIENEMEIVARDYRSKLNVIRNLTAANNKLKMVYELNEQISSTIRNKQTDLALSFIKTRTNYLEMALTYKDLASVEIGNLNGSDKKDFQAVYEELQRFYNIEEGKSLSLDEGNSSRYGMYMTDDNYMLPYTIDIDIYNVSN